MKPELPSVHSGLKLGLALTVVLLVISSPVVILVNPFVIAYQQQQQQRQQQPSPSSASPVADNNTTDPSTLRQGGDDFTAQAPLQIPRTLQSTDLVNSLAFYEVTFITSTTGAIDKIEMVFPAGTGIGAAGIIERVGIGGGTLLKSGSTITYDLTTPVSIPAGTFIRLEMFGIKNPTTPSTTFTADITTRDSGGNLIDGPSQTNVYTIKKIVSSDLADNAVTTPKIADGAIVPDTTTVSADVEISVPPQMLGSSNAFCPSTHPHATGGGITTQSGSEAFMNLSDSFGTSGAWTANMFNTHPSTTFTFRATVTCMADMP